MAVRSRPTWVAVMDAVQVRFFALHRGEDGQVFEEVAAPLSARHESPPGTARAGKPGRADRAAEPRTGAYKFNTTNFAREVAGTLDAAFADKRYDRLVIVAPPRNLSELRDFLTARVRERLAHQIPKNFTKLGTDALWEKLSGILLREARPLNGGPARVSTGVGGSLPVSVVFRNMEASPTVQANALKHAEKLARKYGRIVSCRVTVEAPHHEYRKVKLFRVTIDLKLPGHEIAAGGGDRPAIGDVNAALREAFATAARQMQDHVRRVKGTIVRTRRQSSPRTRGTAQA